MAEPEEFQRYLARRTCLAFQVLPHEVGVPGRLPRREVVRIKVRRKINQLVEFVKQRRGR